MSEDSSLLERDGCSRGRCCLLRSKSSQHFLFNALNSAVSLCGRDPMQAADLLVSISDYLRAALEEERDRIPLTAELEHVRLYFDIQKVRFEERLQVVYDIDSSADCLLPPFMLLQWADNAVRHGIMQRKAGGKISVSAQCRGRQVCIAVEDNGEGIDSERLNALQIGLSAQGSLSNMQERLKALGFAPLQIHSRLHQGTRIEISLPAF